MSLGIVIKSPEGVVLAAESRVTLTATDADGQQLHVNFDNATKLLSFSEPNISVGVVVYGQAVIGLRGAHSFVPEFESTLPSERLPVNEFAQRLSNFMMQQWNLNMPPDYQGPDMTLVIAGYNSDEPYGHVYVCELPRNPNPVERNASTTEFGIVWGGQREFVDRLLQGFDSRLNRVVESVFHPNAEQQRSLQQELQALQMPLPLQAMPLQDCVDLAIFFVRTTIDAQRLTIGIRGCGGPIDVATVTRREGLRFIQRKEITGER